MQPLEKSDIKNDLTQAREDLLGLFSSIDEIEWTTVVYSEGQVWTVADILGHLTGAEASMTRLIEMIRDGGEGVPPDFDLQRWNARGIKKNSDKSPQELIAAMSINRTRFFTLIDEMQDEDFFEKWAAWLLADNDNPGDIGTDRQPRTPPRPGHTRSANLGTQIR